jgi:phosphoribosylaminoimidazolecarboxamide formyltransferase/IMP cyclohydrolase
MMDGRVKTLHPKVHGGLLARRDVPEHVEAMEANEIKPIDMVVVNLYPFESTIEASDVTLEKAVENIDIGGPAMVRSASKNWRDVAVVTDPRLYPSIIEELRASGGSLSLETRARLAALAFTRTASYDLAISSYLASQLSDEDLDLLEPFNPMQDYVLLRHEEDEQSEETEGLPASIELDLAKVSDLRYGENPHQSAAIYKGEAFGGVAGARQLHGKEMSYNNYVDADAAWALVQDIEERAVAIIKHTNPAGVGTGETNEDAYRRALSTDPVSAFGGIVAFNRRVDAGVAKLVNEVFTEVVLAPEFDDDAIKVFKEKKNLRLLEVPDGGSDLLVEYKQISGGFLAQDRDTKRVTRAELTIVTDKAPSDDEVAAMLLAWTVCKHVKSNAIVFAANGQTLGVGAGQMNRVDSVRIAAMRAERFNLPLKGSVLASDAFFPFRDNVDEAAKYGVSAIIQPGGSIKDAESIAAANEHGIAMAFTGIRHFKH